MTKDTVTSNLLRQMEKKIAITRSALTETSENANGDETKSEGKYDTRAIEAAYLAEAQAAQLAIAEESLATLKRFEPRPFEMTEVIGVGALVEADQEGEICFYLLAPTGGGLMTEYLGCDVTVVTPDSRLYQELNGKKMGDELEKPALMITGVE
ncbi:MAG: hypothetical protein P8M04_02760 [Akkermansiaceae bacterium]|jgi:hypothetical protein|nr:hypothetical protein [Akkermansiaceae bacterium]